LINVYLNHAYDIQAKEEEEVMMAEMVAYVVD
jgi:hypothetical protein